MAAGVNPSTAKSAEQDVLKGEYALRLGDDALIMAQRLCEWCADAPFLEEDIAIANVGLDYLGRARLLLQYAGTFLDKTEDELAYFRDSHEFKNLLIVELPRGDFAFSMVRQYFLDEFERLFFTQLANCQDEVLSGIAAKAIKEVTYHHRRSAAWVERLGLGTGESNERTQKAIDALWPYTAEFFVMDDLELSLVTAGLAVDRAVFEKEFYVQVSSVLERTDLRVPEDLGAQLGGRKGQHTEYLGHLLAEMQIMQRSYPGLEW